MTEMVTGLLSMLPEASTGGPEWLRDIRREAEQHLRRDGFPGKKQERWRFTSVRSVVDTAFQRRPHEEAALGEAGFDLDVALGEDDTWRIVCVDGVPQTLSGAPHGVTVRSLAATLRDEPSLLAGSLGTLAPTEHFAALNALMFDDGVVLDIAPGAVVHRPIHVVHVSTSDGGPRASYPRLLVRVGHAADARLIESFFADAQGDGRQLTNAVAEVILADDACLQHTRTTHGHTRAFHLAYLQVAVGPYARYSSQVVTLGGALSRLELGLRFDGPGGEASLDGSYHVDSEEHVDHQITVDHQSPHCTSRVRYRGLVDGNGHGVFNAVGIVRKNARGSAVHQENKNLLLSDGAAIDTKPHLEIECDEVTASHGTTVGAIEPAQLFYLRSRGIPESEARDVLTYAFVRESMESIEHPPTLARAARALFTRLPHGAGLEEMVQ